MDQGFGAVSGNSDLCRLQLNMAGVYEFCLQRVSTVSGQNVSGDYVKDVCLNVTDVVNKTEKYFDSLMDLADIAPVDLATPLMGYAAPCVNILTLILNTILVVSLCHGKSRTPTNVILVAIAICDTLTGLFPLPGYFYMYTFEGHKNYPSLPWCAVISYLGNFAPKVVHTVSLWSRALLAFQRYHGVTKSPFDSIITRYRGVTIAFIVIILVSLLCHSFQFFTLLRPITVIGKEMYTKEGIQFSDTCYQETVIVGNAQYFAYVYTCIRIIIAQILPCVCLLVCNVILIRITYKSYRYRQRLVVGHHQSEVAETRNTIRLTLMLILITSVTCLLELFVDANLILYFVQIYSHNEVVDNTTVGELLVVSNFMIFLSFPLNFFFVLVLSNTFRHIVTSCCKTRLKGTLSSHNTNNNVNTDSSNLKLDDMAYSGSLK